MWRGLAFLLAVCCWLALSGEAVPTRAAESDLMGDADCSGTVNPVDGLVVLRHDSGSADAPCVELADVQCDGDVDPIDALQLLRWDAGLEVSQEEGCAEIGEAVGPAPTSYDLIASALADGDIDQETALIYEFYAAFNDPRLPAQYSGDDSGVRENPALRKLPPLWDGLSQETRDILMPFLRTPPEPDGWYSQQGTSAGSAVEWGTVSAGSRPVKIWWETRFPQDESRAQQIATAIDANIWPQVTGVMSKEPLADCGAGCPSGGGDPMLDIYLVGSGTEAADTYWNPPDSPTCENTAAYIVMLRTETLSTVAHEFMHAVQFAFPYANGDGCSEYDWFVEATGKWAEDLAYPANNEEHDWAPVFLDTTDKPLDYSPDSARKYGAYLFPFYMARVRNVPGVAGDIFAEFETESDSVDGIQTALKSSLFVNGFDDIWADFALKNWNREPVTTYKDRDDLTPGALSISQDLHNDEIELEEATVEHLAAVYLKFRVNDSDVRRIVFKNTLEDTEHASVWAIKKVDEDWKDPEDWSDEEEKRFCRDLPEENVTELIIIISNSDAVDKQTLDPPELPTIEGTPDGCPAWQGTMKSTWTWDNDFGDRAYGTTTTTFEGTWRSDLPGLENVHRCHPPDEEPCLAHLAEGTISWTWDAHISGDQQCDAAAQGEAPAGVYDVLFLDQIFILEPDGPDHYRYWGQGYWSNMPSDQECHDASDCCGPDGPWHFFDLPYNEGPGGLALPAGGQLTDTCLEFVGRIERTTDTIQGTCTHSYRADGPGYYNHFDLVYQWELHRVGPAPDE